MKTLFLIYHEDFETQLRAVLRRGMAVARYTRIDDVVGAHMVEREELTGYMADRRNRLIMVIADDRVITDLISELKLLQRREGHGLRGFVVNAETVF